MYNTCPVDFGVRLNVREGWGEGERRTAKARKCRTSAYLSIRESPDSWQAHFLLSSPQGARRRHGRTVQHSGALSATYLLLSAMAFLALNIRNLPSGTTPQDVVDHINRRASNARPVVGPIVRDPTQQTYYTTVIVRQDSDAKCKALSSKLHLTEFFPRAPESPVRDTKITVSDEFLGVTTVAEHDNPQFEYASPSLPLLHSLLSFADWRLTASLFLPPSVYFVHGLGGHAYRSWSTDRDLPFPQMWPKDFFPNDVGSRPANPNDPSGPKLAGRFSTVGYRASALDTWSATTTIKKAAENFINTIQTSRPAVRRWIPRSISWTVKR